MTNSDLVCIAIGLTLNVLTFFLGFAVGVTMIPSKKKSGHDRDRFADEGFQYYRDDSRK